MSVRLETNVTVESRHLYNRAMLHPDRFFSADPAQRDIARRLYALVKDLPIVSPHGHTDPVWFAKNEAFTDAATLLIKPDHYIFRMLYSQGIALERLGISRRDGAPVETDNRKIWKLFADHWYLFRGTPSSIWFTHALETVFGITDAFSPKTADAIFDTINDKLATPQFRPRALFERFNIEVIATTESPIDALNHHQALAGDAWQTAGLKTGERKGQPRVVTAYRPDPVVDPEFEGFAQNLFRLGELTGEDTQHYHGYIRALENRRAFFKKMGATSTDHGHPNAETYDLSDIEAAALYDRALEGELDDDEVDIFRGHMLVEMARMSCDDGLVMQLHPGSYRNHNSKVFETFGRDKGADIPKRTDYVHSLKPLLDRFGNEKNFSMILFTLDESSYARELAPLAGHYPALKLGPAWWFHDSIEGMLRFRQNTTETAGFYNTVGFNDDTRAFLSIPARHDLARRVDCRYLAQLVAEHRIGEDDAAEVAGDLAYRLAKAAYKL
jgi:glucuronate isomerase